MRRHHHEDHVPRHHLGREQIAVVVGHVRHAAEQVGPVGAATRQRLGREKIAQPLRADAPLRPFRSGNARGQEADERADRIVERMADLGGVRAQRQAEEGLRGVFQQKVPYARVEIELARPPVRHRRRGQPLEARGEPGGQAGPERDADVALLQPMIVEIPEQQTAAERRPEHLIPPEPRRKHLVAVTEHQLVRLRAEQLHVPLPHRVEAVRRAVTREHPPGEGERREQRLRVGAEHRQAALAGNVADLIPGDGRDFGDGRRPHGSGAFDRERSGGGKRVGTCDHERLPFTAISFTRVNFYRAGRRVAQANG